MAADRALQLLQAEREYVQLHRDTTAPCSALVDIRSIVVSMCNCADVARTFAE